MKLSATQIKTLIGVQQAYVKLNTFPPKRDFLANGFNGNTLNSLVEGGLLLVRLYRGRQVVTLTNRGMAFLAAWEAVITEAANAKQITESSLNDERVVERLGKEAVKRIA